MPKTETEIYRDCLESLYEKLGRSFIHRFCDYEYIRNEIKEALDASPLVNATIVVDETIDTEDPDMSSRSIKYTKI